MRVQRQIDQLLAQRAAEWIEMLRTGGDEERRAFAAWLRQSKLHVEHYLELVAIDRELRALDPARCPDVDSLLAEAAPNVIALGRGADTPQTTQPSTGSWRAWRPHAVIAAGIAAAACGLAWLLWPAGQISTAAGEQRTVTLPDGPSRSTH